MGYSVAGEKLEIRTEVEIEASPADVWKALMAVEAYPRWNPFIAAVDGELREGGRIRVLLTPPEGRDVRFSPRIVVLDAERELRWIGVLGMRALFCTEHFFRLQALSASRTRLVHGQNVSGLFTRYLGAAIARTARGCVGMNQALKRYVEHYAE